MDIGKVLQGSNTRLQSLSNRRGLRKHPKLQKHQNDRNQQRPLNNNSEYK